MSEFAGKLNQRIEIWARLPDRLPSGASTDEMNLLTTCRASIAAEGAGAATEAMSVSAMPRFRMLLRANPLIVVDQEVRWKARRLAIQQVLEDPLLPDRMTLRCEEVR